MAKLYYGDENNTAVEINVGGDVSDCIKKDGTTTTTARIPFAKGIGIDSDNYWTERDFVSLTSSDTGGYTQIQNSNGNVAALYSTNPDGSEINNGVKVEPDGLQIMTNGETGTSGQVLTAQGDGTCEWADAGFSLISSGSAFDLYSDGKMAFVKLANPINVGFKGEALGTLYTGSVYKNQSIDFLKKYLPSTPYMQPISTVKVTPNHITWGDLTFTIPAQGAEVTLATVNGRLAATEESFSANLIPSDTVIGPWLIGTEP